MSRREAVLSALFARLATITGPTVLRNAALPETVPTAGLIVLRDGEPGEPDVTLNPRTEYYTHRVALELFAPTAGGEAAIDALMTAIAAALAADRALGGLAENMYLGPLQTDPLAIEGAAPIIAAEAAITVEYLVSDPLAA